MHGLAIFIYYVATGSEEIAGVRGALDALHQELERGETIEASSSDIIKEKVKECFDRSQSAFNKIRMETLCYQDQIDKLTKQKLELEREIEILKQGITLLRLPAYNMLIKY